MPDNASQQVDITEKVQSIRSEDDVDNDNDIDNYNGNTCARASRARSFPGSSGTAGAKTNRGRSK